MPQPVDMPTEVARVTTAERIQQIADRLSLAAQQRVATEEQQNLVDLETTVHQAQPKGAEVDAEMKRRNPFSKRRRHGATPANEAPESAEQPQGPPVPAEPEKHHFDVTV